MAIWTRVVPYVSPRCLAMPGVLWGMGSVGLATTVVGLPFFQYSLIRVHAAVAAITVGTIFLLWLLLVMRVCQQRRAALSASWVFGFGVFCAYIAHMQRSSPDGYFFSARWGITNRAQMMIPVAIASFVVIPFLGTAIATALRLLWVRLKAQPEPPVPQKWCWRCGYDIHGLSSTGCPECGTLLSQSGPSAATIFRVVGSLDRHRRLFIVVFVAMVLAFEAWMVWSRALPAQRFDHRFQAIAQSIDNPVFDHRDMIAYAVPINDQEERYICVRFTPTARSPDPQMELWYASRVYGAGFDGFFLLEFGSLPIRMELGRDRTEYVIQHGIPEGVVHAIKESAAANGWDLTPPVMNRWTSIPAIDPTPYFPKQ